MQEFFQFSDAKHVVLSNAKGDTRLVLIEMLSLFRCLALSEVNLLADVVPQHVS